MRKWTLVLILGIGCIFSAYARTPKTSFKIDGQRRPTSEANYQAILAPVNARVIETFERVKYHLENEKKQSSKRIIDEALIENFAVSTDSPEWAVAKEQILKTYSKIQNLKYAFGFSKDIWCTTSKALAITPPPKKTIHLCRPWLYLDENHMVATIIHEAFHLRGSKVDYLPEEYCHQWKANLVPNEQIRRADAYMLFIYQVGNDGRAIACF